MENETRDSDQGSLSASKSEDCLTEEVLNLFNSESNESKLKDY